MNPLKKTKVRWARAALAMLIALTMLTLMMTIVLAQQGPSIRVTNFTTQSDAPDVAVDSQGNVHIVLERGECTSYYQTFGTSPNRYTVIEWYTFHYDDIETGKFQAILYEDGHIEINVADSTVGKSTITGVNKDATAGIDTGGTPADNSSYSFTWDSVSDYVTSTITYNWEDASGGTCVGAEEDDSSGSVPIGFDFTFYGTSYATVYVSSNGYMSFSDTNLTDTSGPGSFPSGDSGDADVIAPLWTDWNPEAKPRSIWYTMLDNSGNTLIDETLVDTTTVGVKPVLRVNSQNEVHIVWQGDFGDNISHIKLDPYLDDQNGDAASLAAITLVAKSNLYSDDRQQDPRITIDNNDDVHVVWANSDDYEINYMQLDSGGGVVVSRTVVATAASRRQLRPFVAVDSNDNPHIIWNDSKGVQTRETFYTMLSNVDGSHLISATLISDDDDHSSIRSDIVVDEQNMVYVFWADKRGSTTVKDQEIYYTKLDPSLDDQDGDSADEPTITVITDSQLTAADGWASTVPQAAIYRNNICLTWKDNRYSQNVEGDGPPEDVFFMTVDTTGQTVYTETRLTTNPTLSYTHSYADNVINVAVDSSGKAHMVWSDDRDGNYTEIYYTNYQCTPTYIWLPIISKPS